MANATIESTHPGPARAGRRRAGEVLEALIAAGVSQARYGGVDAVVLREATRAVGVTPTAAYRHFSNRDDLLAAVASEAMRLLAIRMQEELEQVHGRKRTLRWARARLRAVGHAYLGFAIDEPGLFQAAFSGARGPHASRPSTETRSPLQILDEVLDDLVTVGALPRARRAPATLLAWSSVHGLATLRLSGAVIDTNPHTLDDALDRFIQRGL
ncbi:TetR/AcrR family transcriptional regulator [soil metagenome]